MSDTKQRLIDAEFYTIYDFWKKTGIMTTNAHYGILSELYFEISKETRPKGKRLNTGCYGCICNAMDLIYNRWPL